MPLLDHGQRHFTGGAATCSFSASRVSKAFAGAGKGARTAQGAFHRYGGDLLLVLLAIGYITADTSKMLLVGWASRDRAQADYFLPSSLLLVQLILSASIDLGLTVAQLGYDGFWLAVEPEKVLRCTPVALFFFVSKTCTVAALQHLDAGTVKLSTQLILPCSALLSVCLIKGRAYSREQWVSIATICVGTLAFNALQLEGGGFSEAPLEQQESRRRTRYVGLLLCGVVVLTNAVGSVVGERLLKGEQRLPLVCLKARLDFAELLVVLPVLHYVEAPSRGMNWFAGWDWRVFICSLGWVPATWMSTLITARFSTVVKNLMQCVATLVTYFLALMDPSSVQHSMGATLLALTVMSSVSMFSLQRSPPAEPADKFSEPLELESDSLAGA